MKFTLIAVLASTASAFMPPTMTFAVGKKPAAKVTPAATKAVTKAVVKKAAPAVKKAAPVAKKAAPVAKKAPAPAPKKVVVKAVVAKPKPVVKAVVKPVVKKVAPKPVAFKTSKSGSVPSQAIPGEDAPAILDGSLIGDAGFDPCFLSTKADTVGRFINNRFLRGKSTDDGLFWYREAELMNGRIAQVAWLGFVAPGFGTLPGNEFFGVDAFIDKNPLEALSSVPGISLFQILAVMHLFELRRVNNIIEAGPNYIVGDAQRWGQGEGRWNPFNFNYTPEEYAIKQEQELNHCRVAMIGFLGVLLQASASGESVVEQLGAAFTAPDFYARAGYFFPEGI